MKHAYVVPDIEVINYALDDVVTASAPEPTLDNGGQNGGDSMQDSFTDVFG